LIIASSQYRIHQSQADSHKGKPLGKRECVPSIAYKTAFILYFEQLESSVTIYSVLQVVLFVELLSHMNEIFGILQIVRKF